MRRSDATAPTRRGATPWPICASKSARLNRPAFRLLGLRVRRVCLGRAFTTCWATGDLPDEPVEVAPRGHGYFGAVRRRLLPLGGGFLALCGVSVAPVGGHNARKPRIGPERSIQGGCGPRRLGAGFPLTPSRCGRNRSSAPTTTSSSRRQPVHRRSSVLRPATQSLSKAWFAVTGPLSSGPGRFVHGTNATLQAVRTVIGRGAKSPPQRLYRGCHRPASEARAESGQGQAGPAMAGHGQPRSRENSNSQAPGSGAARSRQLL
jgi:hypothetical protein